MDLLTGEELRSLFDPREEPCVSVFIPTHRAGREVRQDSIRLKNLLREAETRLVESSLRRAEARKVLSPARQLLPQAHFWRHQSDGLAIFLAREFFRCYRLPVSFPELIVLAERFHIKPLLPLFTGDGRYHVLALSQKQIKLFDGTRHTISEVDLCGVPRSLSEALKYDDPEKQVQFRTLHAGAAWTALFHVHRTEVDRAKQNLLRYFRVVDRGLNTLLKDQRVPMVLAGVDYLLPIYREASTYASVLREGITGNPDSLSEEELHAAAWRLVESHFRRSEGQARGQFRELSGTHRVSTDIKEILSAAANGRVEHVFVPIGVQKWGSFNPEENLLVLHEAAAPGDEDVLNLIAMHTIVNGGTVHAVAPSKVPEGAPAAAVFRY